MTWVEKLMVQIWKGCLMALTLFQDLLQLIQVT